MNRLLRGLPSIYFTFNLVLCCTNLTGVRRAGAASTLGVTVVRPVVRRVAPRIAKLLGINGK
eukprot:310937-Pleurochrysis_carterae.AAC.1